MATNPLAMDTYNFVVTLDPSNSPPIRITRPELEGLPPLPLPPLFPVNIARGISLITFTLVPGDADAQFPSNPMQWFDDAGQPVLSPPWFLCHQIDNWHFSLWDYNSAPAETHHHFELSVWAGGTIFTTKDPMFINDPPAQPQLGDEY